MSLVKIRAALELAIDAMTGLVPASAIVSSTNGVMTTQAAHGLVSNTQVLISGHSVAELNGTWLAQVQSATAFALLHPVTKVVQASVAAGVAGVCKAQLTAWEGAAFKPVPGLPYQRVNNIFATPENPSFGSKFYRQLGFMQVTLYYPVQRGTVDIETRADLIRTMFPRGASFAVDNVTVKISKTAEVYPFTIVDEFIAMVIRIPYWADICS